MGGEGGVGNRAVTELVVGPTAAVGEAGELCYCDHAWTSEHEKLDG